MFSLAKKSGKNKTSETSLFCLDRVLLTFTCCGINRSCELRYFCLAAARTVSCSLHVLWRPFLKTQMIPNKGNSHWIFYNRAHIRHCNALNPLPLFTWQCTNMVTAQISWQHKYKDKGILSKILKVWIYN